MPDPYATVPITYSLNNVRPERIVSAQFVGNNQGPQWHQLFPPQEGDAWIVSMSITPDDNHPIVYFATVGGTNPNDIPEGSDLVYTVQSQDNETVPTGQTNRPTTPFAMNPTGWFRVPEGLPLLVYQGGSGIIKVDYIVLSA